MSSANFKPKRTAAASRSFLATARLSCLIINGEVNGKCFTSHVTTVIGVGDRGPQNSGKIFFGQNHLKFGHFVNYSGKYHVKFGNFVNFSCICFRAKCLSPKLTEVLYAYDHGLRQS